MSNATIKNDRTSILIEEMDKAVEIALEMCGARIEERAKDLAPVDTGALRDSILHEYDSSTKSEIIGVPERIDYGKYQELGTSKMKAQPYLKPSVDINDIQKIFKEVIPNSVK